MRTCSNRSYQTTTATLLLAVLFPVFACGTKANDATPPVTASASASASASVAPVVEEPWVPSAERLARLDENTGLVVIDMPRYIPRFFLRVTRLGKQLIDEPRRGERLEIEVPLGAEIQVFIWVWGYKHFSWSGRVQPQERYVRTRLSLIPREEEFSSSLGYNVFDLPADSGAIVEPPVCGEPNESMFDLVYRQTQGVVSRIPTYPFVGRGMFISMEGIVWFFEELDYESHVQYTRVGRVDPATLLRYKQLIPLALADAEDLPKQFFSQNSHYKIRMHPEPSTKHILGEPVVVLDGVRKDYSIRRNADSEKIVRWVLAVYFDTLPSGDRLIY